MRRTRAWFGIFQPQLRIELWLRLDPILEFSQRKHALILAPMVRSRSLRGLYRRVNIVVMMLLGIFSDVAGIGNKRQKCWHHVGRDRCLEQNPIRIDNAQSTNPP